MEAGPHAQWHAASQKRLSANHLIIFLMRMRSPLVFFFMSLTIALYSIFSCGAQLALLHYLLLLAVHHLGLRLRYDVLLYHRVPFIERASAVVLVLEYREHVPHRVFSTGVMLVFVEQRQHRRLVGYPFYVCRRVTHGSSCEPAEVEPPYWLVARIIFEQVLSSPCSQAA